MAPTRAKKGKNSVAKKPKKSAAKNQKNSDAKRAKESVEGSGWKKPASKRNLDPSGPLLRSKCHFFKLPLELRFMIYSDLIRSGNLEFLRSCQRIYKEALEITYRDGIYLVEEHKQSSQPRYVYGGGRVSNQRESIGDKIRNVAMWTDLSNFLSPGEGNEAIDYLGTHYPELKNPKISRKDCWIHLWAYPSSLGEDHLDDRLEIMLRALRAFDNVFLNIFDVTRSSNLLGPWKIFDYPERWFEVL